MRQVLFVISDLHLGGPPATETTPDLEMCTPQARQRLAHFIRDAAEQRHEQQDVRLVINGDIVDFLAEEGATPFLRDDSQARKVLQGIMDRTHEVWTALRDFADSGAALTLMLGNHDIELSLPGPRRLLLERLGPGRVEFIYDNQAFVDGPVLIEHGNRYDTWNMVPHNRLRHVRAKLSRREVPRHYPNVPGSELVCKVVNRLKKKYRFVDLLKPETEAVLPALPALDPSPAGFLYHASNSRHLCSPAVPTGGSGMSARQRHGGLLVWDRSCSCAGNRLRRREGGERAGAGWANCVRSSRKPRPA